MPSLTSFADIYEYHADAEASLRVYYSPAQPSYQTRFAGYLPSEVASELNERLSETELRSILIVLARIEAAFRVDYKARAKTKGSDEISVKFRRIHADKGDRARLEDDILQTWKDHLEPANRQIISELRGMLKFRHWLAHGRYWNQGSNHTFQDAFLLANVIMTGFNLQS